MEEASPPLQASELSRLGQPPINSRKALLLFTLPLATVNILQLLSQQIILGGISRHPASLHGAAEDLAAFIVALSITWLATSPIQGLGRLFLAFGDGPRVRGRLFRFAFTLGLACTVLLALLAFTDAGYLLITRVQGLSSEMARRIQFALGPMVFWPAIDVFLQIDNAVLKRSARSGTLALANVLGLACTLATVLCGNYLHLDPLRMAPLAYLIGQGMRVAFLAVSVTAFKRENHAAAIAAAAEDSQRTAAATPSWSMLSYFYLPVTFNILLMLLSRPMIQWFLSMDPSPETAIAAFGVALSVSQLFYNWMTELSTHSIAFRNQPEVLRVLPRFCAGIAIIMTVLMTGLFWTPLGGYLLSSLMGLSGELLSQSCAALAVMALCPAVVAIRAHHHGLATLYKDGNAWMTSAVARIVANLLVMLLLPFFGMNGAMLGMTAILAGFLFEALTLAWSFASRMSAVRVPVERRAV
jgi:hypothetical protein